MGCGIWSMHFIGMLALQLAVPIRYGVALSALSLVVAIVAAGFALMVANRASLSLRASGIGGLIMGIAIAGMHYTGMAAMVSPVSVHFHAGLWWLSVASRSRRPARHCSSPSASSITPGSGCCRAPAPPS